MADKAYMGTTVIAGATTGFCKIKEPDTGNPNAKNKNFRSTAPKWTAEIKINRERDALLLSDLKSHADENGYNGDKGEEPWVKTKAERTSEDGTVFPSYEYIDVMTKNDPHTPTKTTDSRIVDVHKKAFTSEVFNNSEVNVVFNPHYTEVHNYRMTFYLDALQVMKNGSGGGGGNPMDLLAAPSFGDDEVDVMAALDTTEGAATPSFN